MVKYKLMMVIIGLTFLILITRVDKIVLLKKKKKTRLCLVYILF